MLRRSLSLPKPSKTSFFLWGPRQTGKSTLLQATYPEAPRIDLLSSRQFARLSRDPGLLREQVESSGTDFIIIDEIQKVRAALAQADAFVAEVKALSEKVPEAATYVPGEIL